MLRGTVSLLFDSTPDPSLKYQSYSPINLTDRQWPSAIRRSAPTWLSADLRDGNQALPNPMTVEQKQKFFDMLIKIGFKEIEVGYPSASETEYKFVRSLIANNAVPDDVWLQVFRCNQIYELCRIDISLQVLTPSRPELIRKTLESVSGAKNVIVHVYLGIAKIFRDLVLRKSPAETIDLAVKCTALIRDLTNEYASRYGTNFRFNFGVESFSQAEPSFVIDLCEQIKRTWGKAGPGNKRLIFNLAASVEIAPPNHFADQVRLAKLSIKQANEC
jgi:2-isopropylmalate synthase